MNIGIDISALVAHERTGVGEYAFQLLDALFDIDKKNQYFLFCNSWKRDSKKLWEQKNVHFLQTHYPNKIFHTLLFFFRWPKVDALIVREYKKKYGINIGHLNIFFSPNLSFFSVSKTCKHIQMIHDLSFELFPEFFSKKMRVWHKFLLPKKQCKEATAIFVPSENTKRDVHDMYSISEEKIHVMSPGVSSYFLQARTQNRYGKEQEVKKKYDLPQKFILFLGTLEPRKNIRGLLSAYAQSRASKEYALVLAGPKGWKYKKIVKSIATTLNVKYIGYVEEVDKPFLYGLSRMFLYPSFYEGFGIPVLEALYSGIPVITSNRSSLPEISSGSAVLVDPHNPAEIQQALDRIIFSESVCSSLKDLGTHQAKNFDSKKLAEKFLHFVRGI